MGYREPGWPDYVVKAAPEAREESQRYWAKGGYADKKYPKYPMRGWSAPQTASDRAIHDMRQRKGS